MTGIPIADEILPEIAPAIQENSTEAFGAESCGIEMFADGIVEIRFHFAGSVINPYPPENRSFLTPTAICTFHGSKTEAGMKFPESIHLPAER